MLLVAYAVVLVVMVLLGAHTGRFLLLNHTRTQLVMSFVSGMMLGIAVFHLLPHALYAGAGHVSIDFVAIWLMAGIVVMFLLQRVFHFHQHDFDESLEGIGQAGAGAQEHLHSHDDHHGLASGVNLGGEPHGAPIATELGGWGVLLGLALHSLLDGVALAASMQVDWLATGNTGLAGLAGIGVFLAIFLHKPLDAMTIGVFMQRQRAGVVTRLSVLIAYGLLCPAAAAVLLFGLPLSSVSNPAFVVGALAFSAGLFLCIALSDLLPEIHFHSHDRVKMTAALLLGIALSFSLKNIESVHEHPPELMSVEPDHHRVSGE